ADAHVTRAIKVAPNDPNVQEFKKENDAIMASMKGKMPDVATVEQIPQVNAQKTDAGTLVQDGKLLYEMGKFEEADVKLHQALEKDPDNQAAFYYLNLVKQAYYEREEHKRITGQQDAMLQVQKEWTPKTGVNLPSPNPYATNMDVHTGVGREIIYNKLSRIQLDKLPWPDGLPLSEVMRYLSEQS